MVARQPGSFVELRLSLSTTTSRKLTLYRVNVVTSQQSVSVFVFSAVVIGNAAVTCPLSSLVGWRAVLTHDSRP